jgi:hypothetical protein
MPGVNLAFLASIIAGVAYLIWCENKSRDFQVELAKLAEKQ